MEAAPRRFAGAFAQAVAKKNEDRAVLLTDSAAQRIGADAVAAVYDGHGGVLSAEMMRDELLDTVVACARELESESRGPSPLPGQSVGVGSWVNPKTEPLDNPATLWELKDGDKTAAQTLDRAVSRAFELLDKYVTPLGSVSHHHVPMVDEMK